MDYKRIFIEKKNDISAEGKKLLKEFREYLGIDDLQNVRVINVYDLINASKEDAKLITDEILYEPVIDLLHEKIILNENEKAFRVEYLKGQYNQREDATKELINDFILDKEIDLLNSKIIILENITEEGFEKVKSYFINPIEMKEISMDSFTYEKEADITEKVMIIDGFTEFSLSDMQNFKSKYGIGMDMEDLMHCQKYFRDEKRNPSITEIKLIDTYWSDHCRHTTFMTEITDITFHEGKYKEVFEQALGEYLSSREFVYENRQRAVSLMDLATINMKEVKKKGLLEDKEESEEVNAASIEIDVDINGKTEKWLLMFKNETHNHPTEMEPFGGAATCLGGAIRDPLSGRSFVYQAMRITGSADPRHIYEDTLPGKLPQRKITQTAMEGYSSYGNQIGASTGYVKEVYDEGFLAKRMECGALVAAAPKDWVYRGSSEPGDIIILVGGKTGRDGLGGAVGSSKEHTEESLHTSGAEVQKGNPPLERKILRLFRKEKVSRMIKVCNDFGAGGVGVAIGELADGLVIELDKVPLKYPGLDGTEIALAESQERMAVVIDQKDVETFMKEIENEDLEGTVVAKVTEEKILKMVWKDEEIVNIHRSFLDTNGIRKKIKVQVEQPADHIGMHSIVPEISKFSIRESFVNIMKDLNIGSQKGLMENFDNTVSGGTVLMPYGGKHQLTPSEGMVAKIPVLNGETNTCSIMTYGYDPKLSKWSPFHGGYYAVIESIGKIVALGGDYKKVRLTFQEYFERLGDDELKWGKPLSSLLGAYLVQKQLDIAAIGGKDSMSGTFEDINVPPTLISFAVTSEDVKNIISNEFKNKDSKVVLIPLEIDDKGLINFDELKSKYGKIKELIDENIILAAQTIKYGGISRAIMEMSFGNKIGFKFENINKEKLFAPMYGSMILEVSRETNLDEVFSKDGYEVLGHTTETQTILIGEEAIELNELINSWESPLDEVFSVVDKKLEQEKAGNYNQGTIIKNKIKISKPKVLIPVFTGTHGEYTLARAFEEAGGEVETFVFKSFKKEYINESYKELARKIKEAQIIGLPNGATLGNEPETGGKLIKLILDNPYIKEEINNHLSQRDGLIIGIGNGFQGLIKSGLISKGKVSNIDKNSPYITYNDSGDFISTMVDIEVKSNLSPWMSEMNVGDIYTVPVATMEGRIIVSNDGILSNGQVASQFISTNPTGSDYNIESLTSLDGRILGTISAIDRYNTDLYKNIELKGRHKIFESGIKYFD